MRHSKSTKTLGRVKRQREALLRSLARSLVMYEHIDTTEAKAKALRPFIEKLITKGKANSLASHRIVLTRLGGQREAKKLLQTIVPKYKDRAGGYTRIIKLTDQGINIRKRARIEFV
ncbi:50S ribosomal protein L17 [Patescibacteria group bacterium]|nr:50S ribosomal protein L17 [Patescibacteria group bacterium]